MSTDEQFDLLARATEGVEIVPCDRCDAEGNIPGVPTGVKCKHCGGSKLTTRRKDG